MPGILMGKLKRKSGQSISQNKSQSPLNHSKKKKKGKSRKKSMKMACLSDQQWNINKFQDHLKSILKANTPVKKLPIENPVTVNNNISGVDFIPISRSSYKNNQCEAPELNFNKHLTSSTPYKKSSTEVNRSTQSFSLFSPIVDNKKRSSVNVRKDPLIPITETISLDDEDSQCLITIDRVGSSSESSNAQTIIDLDSTEFNDTMIPNTVSNKQQIDKINCIDLTDVSEASSSYYRKSSSTNVLNVPPKTTATYDLTDDSTTNDIVTKSLTVDKLAQGMLGQCYQPSNSLSGYFGTNIYRPKVDRTPERPTGLRMIVIDGSNVAMQRTHGKFFSTEGLKICIDYFLKRGHVVRAFVPRFRNKNGKSSNPKLLQHLEEQGHVVYTPSRVVRGKVMNSYDDRYIVQCAASFGGVIVSCDDYRDIMMESESLRETIENRLLPFTWVDDMIMFPQDPLGKNGPRLDTFLRHP